MEGTIGDELSQVLAPLLKGLPSSTNDIISTGTGAPPSTTSTTTTATSNNTNANMPQQPLIYITANALMSDT